MGRIRRKGVVDIIFHYICMKCSKIKKNYNETKRSRL